MSRQKIRAFLDDYSTIITPAPGDQISPGDVYSACMKDSYPAAIRGGVTKNKDSYSNRRSHFPCLLVFKMCHNRLQCYPVSTESITGHDSSMSKIARGSIAFKNLTLLTYVTNINLIYFCQLFSEKFKLFYTGGHIEIPVPGFPSFSTGTVLIVAIHLKMNKAQTWQ